MEQELDQQDRGRREYLVSEPIQVAARAADKMGGDRVTRQAAFEALLAEVRQLRDEAERSAGGSAERAAEIFTLMLSEWTSRAHTLEIAPRPGSTDHEESTKASATLDALKAGAAAAGRPEAEKDRRHA